MLLLSLVQLIFTLAASAADHPAVHGMLVLGEKTIYLSHLPMFHNPHDYQVILEARLSPAAEKAYAESRKLFPEETVYTLVPERFSLPMMMAEPRPFRAQLFRGHFERGGMPITDSFVVDPGTVLLFRKLDPQEPKGNRHYYLVGNPEEAFLAHAVAGKPSFDHWVEAHVEGAFPPGINRLDTGAEAGPLEQAELESPSLPGARIRIGAEIYREFSDLSH